MKFEVNQDFGCTPQDFWRTLLSTAFIEELASQTEFSSEILMHAEEAKVIRRTQRVKSDRRVSRPMAALFGVREFSYLQDDLIDLNNNVIHWQIRPPLLDKRIQISGRTEIVSSDSGCRREVRGEVSVDIPVVGRAMERQVVSGIKDSSVAIGTVMATVLRETGRGFSR